jgi:hypothetical protein
MPSLNPVKILKLYHKIWGKESAPNSRMSKQIMKIYFYQAESSDQQGLKNAITYEMLCSHGIISHICKKRSSKSYIFDEVTWNFLIQS